MRPSPAGIVKPDTWTDREGKGVRRALKDLKPLTLLTRISCRTVDIGEIMVSPQGLEPWTY